MKHIIAAAFFSLSAATFAENTEEPPVLLSVKPSLCITDERTTSCDITFMVVWQSARKGYYCVYNDLDEEALRCWSDQRSGELSDRRNVRNQFSYWLNQGRDEPELVTVTVEVLRMDSNDRRRRRRTRHVWDLL